MAEQIFVTPGQFPTKQVGSNIPWSGGAFGDGLVTNLLPIGAFPSLYGKVFMASYPAAALAAASATVLGAFALFNPVNSGVYACVLDITTSLVSFTASTTPLQVAIVPFNNTPTSIGAGPVPTCANLGNTNAAALKTYVSGTTVGSATTPITRQVATFYLDLAAGDVQGWIKDEPKGLWIQPGWGINPVAIATVPTNTAAISYTWMEVVPVP